ncbi:hypothetical protein [Acaryochloris thomasi]|nr:hypothetical protein [Acaryochloris thomasi]
MSESERYAPQNEKTEDIDASSITPEVREYVASQLARILRTTRIGPVPSWAIGSMFCLVERPLVTPITRALRRSEYRSLSMVDEAKRAEIVRQAELNMPSEFWEFYDEGLSQAIPLSELSSGIPDPNKDDDGEELDEETLSEELEIIRALVNEGDAYILNNQFQTQKLADSTHSTLTKLEELVKDL